MNKRWLLALLPLVVTHPTFAVVRTTNQPVFPPSEGGDQPAPAAQQSQVPPNLPLPTTPQTATPAMQTQTIQAGTETIQIPKDLTKLTPEQSRALLENTNLSAEQMEAVARSLDNFQGSGAPMGQATMTTPPPATIGTPQGTPMGQGMVGPATAGGTPPQSAPPSLGDMQRDDAFNGLLNEVLPLSPDQITRLHKFYDLTLQAKATPPHAPPTPHFSSTVINLEPGSSPPVIRLAAGFVSSLLFVDTTGGAWPISAYSLGDPQNFNIQWDQKSNALFIQSLKQYGHGNLAVRLTGLDTPIMITLVSGQRNVDFRVDLQVAGHRGPNAAPPVVDSAISANVNPILINLLDGVPPKNSIKLGVSGGYGEAWYADSRVYFRTRLTVLSPAWTATAASPDGTHVYELMQTPYILASHNGKTVDIKLSGL